jgi:hypothetical protein
MPDFTATKVPFFNRRVLGCAARQITRWFAMEQLL